MTGTIMPCPSHPGYGVTRAGEVYSFNASRGPRKKPRRLKPKTDECGYLRLTIRVSGAKRYVGVHALVLDAFAGPKPSKDHITRHLDGNRTNNDPTNLAWGTAAENTADRIAHGNLLSRERHPRAILREEDVALIRSMRAAGRVNARRLSAIFGVAESTIRAAAKRETWK